MLAVPDRMPRALGRLGRAVEMRFAEGPDALWRRDHRSGGTPVTSATAPEGPSNVAPWSISQGRAGVPILSITINPLAPVIRRTDTPCRRPTCCRRLWVASSAMSEKPLIPLSADATGPMRPACVIGLITRLAGCDDGLHRFLRRGAGDERARSGLEFHESFAEISDPGSFRAGRRLPRLTEDRIGARPRHLPPSSNVPLARTSPGIHGLL